MIPIIDVRDSIANIPGALYKLDPEEVERGNKPGVKTLWEELASALISNNTNFRNYVNEFETYTMQPIEEIFEIGAEIDEDMLVKAMGDGAGDRIKQSSQTSGTDGLAWYTTFHTIGIQWGIFIPLSSILYLTAKVFNKLDTDWDTKFRIAFRALHQHELFHFAVDYMSCQWEAFTGKPCHRPARKLKDAEKGYNILEEKLANASMLRSLLFGNSRLRVPGKMEALKMFTEKQPEGYRDGKLCSKHEDFLGNSEHLMCEYINCIDGYDIQFLNAIHLAELFKFPPKIDWRYCPIHILHDEDEFDIPSVEISLFRRITGISETKAFKKKLAKLSRPIKEAWKKAKEHLGQTTAFPGLNFKHWERKKGATIYSVRVKKGYRAHLAYSNPIGEWSAVAIGNHKEMGHG